MLPNNRLLAEPRLPILQGDRAPADCFADALLQLILLARFWPGLELEILLIVGSAARRDGDDVVQLVVASSVPAWRGANIRLELALVFWSPAPSLRVLVGGSIKGGTNRTGSELSAASPRVTKRR